MGRSIKVSLRHRFASTLLVVFCVSYVALPQSTNSHEIWSEELRNETVAFGQILTDDLTHLKYFHTIGAGVIISTDPITSYLVTVKHMFCDPDKNFYPSELQIRFAWQEHRSIYQELGISLQLRDQSGGNLWASLDDGGDVAAIAWPISFFNNLPEAARPPSGRVDVLNFEDVVGGAFDGEPVYILGYPSIVGDEKLVRAILRQGIVAWTNPNAPDDRTFLVDASVVPGNSGGPVMNFPFGVQKDGSIKYFGPGKIQLLGLVSKARSSELKMRVGNQVVTASVDGVGSIGEIEPSSRIRNLITAIQKGNLKPSVCDVPETKGPIPSPK